MSKTQVGTILKIEREKEAIFYQITSESSSACGVVPICRISKGGYLTIKIRSQESQIFKSDAARYRQATKAEVGEIITVLGGLIDTLTEPI